jgi:hypothetical protein
MPFPACILAKTPRLLYSLWAPLPPLPPCIPRSQSDLWNMHQTSATHLPPVSRRPSEAIHVESLPPPHVPHTHWSSLHQHLDQQPTSFLAGLTACPPPPSPTHTHRSVRHQHLNETPTCSFFQAPSVAMHVNSHPHPRHTSHTRTGQ